MDRVRHDHPSIETATGTVGTRGATDRPTIRLHADQSGIQADEIARIVLDGAVRYGAFRRFGDRLECAGIYDTPDAARAPGSRPDRLRDWLDARELGSGRTVHVDIIHPGERYGLRAPGETVRYDVPPQPDSTLRSIADRYFKPDGES